MKGSANTSDPIFIFSLKEQSQMTLGGAYGLSGTF